MNKRKMREHNTDMHRNASYRWRGIDTDKTYKNLKPKNRNSRSCFDWHERTKKELAKMRKEDVKARKQRKARANWCRKIKERKLDWFDWFNWVEAKKSSNNWRKTR